MLKFLKSFARDLWFTTTLRRVLLFSLLIGVYAIIPLFEFKFFDQSITHNLQNLEAIFGVVIGLVLIFRANRAYERWWEARTLWGNLINISRNLAMKIRTIVKLDRAQLNEVSNFIIYFAVALKDQLKQQQIQKNTLQEKTTLKLTNDFYMKVKTWREKNDLSIEEFWIIDQELRQFMDILGGCEKIKNTLISPSFRVFSRQMILLFILILPWVFISSLGYIIIIFSIIGTYVIMGIEEIAFNLEEPFGSSEDHLDMTQMVKTIETSTLQILNQEAG